MYLKLIESASITDMFKSAPTDLGILSVRKGEIHSKITSLLLLLNSTK